MSDLFGTSDPAVHDPLHRAGLADRAELPVHRIFEEWAARLPEAPAVRLGSASWSYGELERQANRLAQALRDLGVGPEVRVGLHVERSFDLLVGILGTLKAGGAYVPLDPDYPRERLDLVMADAGIAVLLTQGTRRGRPAPLDVPGIRTVSLDALGEGSPARPDRRPDARPPLRSFPDSPAYVLYTSGSTGRPKGVVVSHRALSNHMRWMLETWPLAPGDAVLQRTPTSFDASVWELFAPLLAGVPLVLAPPGAQADAALLAGLIAERSVTVLQCVPSLLEALLEEPGFAACRSLRRVYCGGEALSPELAARFRARSGARLINLYGPTEATIDATWWDCGEGDAPVAIGRPIAGLQAYVTDEQGELAAPGTEGELLLGGVGLARGYLDRPDLTAERFVPNPWPEAMGERLYRTGDLVRTRPDGALEYRGRVDHQIKLRGFRIEPGEVEGALRRLPGVRQAAVVAAADGRGGKRLVGYVVLSERGASRPEGSDRESLAELRRGLVALLPEPMVPTAWVLLSELPLAPNGKLDRAALPPYLAPQTDYVAPRPGLESEIAAIFAEVLELERVGAEDDFFALGGHSLSAQQVASRLRSRVGAEIPARTLFEHPTVRVLAEVVDLLPVSGDFGWRIQRLERPVHGEAGFEASFAQQRLWVADRYSPARALFNSPCALDLRGPLDAAALEGALLAAVRRHEPLRTVFRFAGDGLRQEVRCGPDRLLPRIDLSALPEAARAAEGERLESEEARRPFDLAEGPVVRFLLLRRAAGEHTLLALFHHIAYDDWSGGLLLRDLARFYPAARGARQVAVPLLPLQVADFAAWQRRWFEGERSERELAWWRSRLAPPLPLLDLPADRPRPAVRSFRGAVRHSRLGRERIEALAAVAAPGEGAGTSLFMLLLAVFSVLLARHAEAEVLVVGTPIANRGRSEVEELIGFFVNTLALRLELGGSGPGPGFREVVGRVREVLLDAFLHQDLPFELLLEALWQERDPARSPLFDVMIIHGNTPPPPRALEPGLAAAWREIPTGTAKLDLTLTLQPEAGGLSLAWEYDSDLFDAATVAAWARRFEALAAACAASPEAPVAVLPLLARGEADQLLREWRAGGRSGEAGETVPGLFARQAARSPERTALAFAAETWSYRRLDERSNRLARRLRALGVGPEVRVGVCVERSADMVALLLAVQKAGGAYVPLDPGYPAERLAYVLADSGARLVVSEERLRERLAEAAGEGIAWLLLDADPASLDTESAEPLPSRSNGSAAEGARLAYVLYTSGSTGRPKGVGVSQRALVSFLLSMAERPGCGEYDRVPALTTLSFDIAALEIYLPLVTGGRVVVLERSEAQDGPRLAARLAAMGATLVQATPATFRLLLEADWQPALSASGPLRVLCGGEALPRDLAEALLARGVELWNVYGPTEATVWSSAGRIELGGGGPVELGAPLANTRFFVAGRTGELVPPGVPGELRIGGAGVARGYPGRPELTAERFVPDPWSGEPGARVYRTGDLVRRHEGGRLEFLGRIDDQVKVRGFRIELGEVEAAFAASAAPVPLEAFAVVAAGEGSDRFLAAFLVAREGSAPEVEALRESLRQRLPEYMVPTSWAFVERLPLTPNGKIDRRELARRAVQGTKEGEPGGVGPTPPIGPRNPVEELLAALFAEVLGRSPVGIRDDFFLLGGHSLLALRLLRRLREESGIDLPFPVVFEAPTVESLACRIEAAAAGREHEEALLLAPQPRAAELPPSFSQERFALRASLALGTGGGEALGLTLGLSGPVRPSEVEAALSLLAARHEALRTLVRPSAAAPGRWAQEILPAVLAILPRVDLNGLPPLRAEREGRRLAREERCRPFAVEGPPLRALLLLLAPGTQRLALALSPVAADHWSLETMSRDLGQLLVAAIGGREPALPPLPLQFADFAICQRRWMSGRLLERQLATARARLRGAPQVLDLPTDFPRPARRRALPAIERLDLGSDAELGFEDLRSRTATTRFMVFLAAYQALLARLSGQPGFLVGTPYPGRDQPQLQELVGPFANPLVVRSDLAGDPSFEELAVRTRGQALAAFAARSLPWEKLIEAFGSEGDPSLNPLFQALFSQEPPIEARPQPLVEAAGISLAVTELDAASGALDLALNLVEEGGSVRAEVRYAADLFAATSIRRFSGHYRNLLRHAAARPGTPLSALSLLAPAERQQLLVEWSGEPAAQDWPGTVEEQLRGWVRELPDRPAVLLGDRSWTYAELDRRAEEIARTLAGAGVGPGAVVAVLLDRSFDLLATLVAVLRTGAAYLPIDPAMRKYNNAQTEAPAADNRFVFMMSTAGVRFVVVEELYRRSLPEGGWRWISAEGLGEGTDLEVPASWPSPEPSSLAYVMFTSGSTGLPKGLAISHSAQVRHARAIVSEFRLGPSDRALQYASMGFDVSGEEIWPTLVAGGAVVLVEDPQQLPPRELSPLVDRQGLTVLNLPSPYWQEWLEHLRQDGAFPPAGLRRVVVGSDAVSLARLAQWQELAGPAGRPGAGSCGWHHAYGLTETTVTSTLYRAEPAAPPRRGLPIGRPLPGVRAYVVDREGEPVPVGVPGELWLGGEMLAQGCLAQPDVTADLFAPDPFAPWGTLGARVCRTGDLVRRLPDGALEFLGRIESQIHLRGLRVEPGDVEAALESSPGVASALVMAVGEEPAPRLQAFVVPASAPDDAEAAKRGILEAVRQRLAGFLVPSSLHLLERLPTSENGKFDRRRLAALAETGVSSDRIFLAPETLVERELADLWRGVLHLEWVGAQESFWNLGGHSLLATRMLGRVAQTFGVDLPLQVLFQHPVLRDLARRIEAELLADGGEGEAGPMS